MTPRLLGLAALLSVLSSTVRAQDRPEEFVTHLRIQVGSPAPYYRVSVPLSAYLASAHGDLRDLRIWNGEGQPMPFARLRAQGGTEEVLHHERLPAFPLHGLSSEGIAVGPTLRVLVQQSADGTLVSVTRQTDGSGAPNPSAERCPGYVLDASRLQDGRAARALVLDWEGGTDFIGLDLESSEDLREWHPVVSGIQLARLDFGGARIENRRIELAGFRGRYLRLLWDDASAAPRLTGAEVESWSTRELSAPLLESTPLPSVPPIPGMEAGEYRFELPQPLPIERITLELPPGNQVLPVEILAPAADRRAWRSLGREVVYRIHSGGQEWSRSVIPLSGRPIREFVLKVDARLDPLTAGPRLTYAIQPEQVLFLARGEGPFTLSVGNADAGSTRLDPRTLVPGYGSPGSPEIVVGIVQEDAVAPVGATRTRALTPPPDWKKIVLWAVLLAGVLGLAWMAWSLLGQMKKDDGGG